MMKPLTMLSVSVGLMAKEKSSTFNRFYKNSPLVARKACGRKKIYRMWQG